MHLLREVVDFTDWRGCSKANRRTLLRIWVLRVECKTTVSTDKQTVNVGNPPLFLIGSCPVRESRPVNIALNVAILGNKGSIVVRICLSAVYRYIWYKLNKAQQCPLAAVLLMLLVNHVNT